MIRRLSPCLLLALLAFAAFPANAAPAVAASATSQNVSGTSHTCDLPASISSGQFLVLDFLVGANTASQTISTPSGWTKQEESLEQFARQYAVFTRTADGGEGSTVSITTGTAGQSVCGSMRITDHNGYDTSDKSVSPGFDSTEDSPSVTVANNDSLVLVGWERSGNESATLTEPGSTTNVFDDTYAAAGLRHAINYFTASAGSSGTSTWSTSGDGWNQAWTLVVAPAAGGGSVIPVLHHQLRNQ